MDGTTALTLGLAVSLLIGLLVGLVIGALVVTLRFRSAAAAAADAAAAPKAEDPALVEARHQHALSELRASERAEHARLRAELAALQATEEALRAQLVATAEGMRAQVAGHEARFRELVEQQRIDAKRQAEREREESRILSLLTPVQESLRTMQSKVTEIETQRTLQHGQLSEQLKNATESEERLRNTAESLASALRSNSTRGVWGETQLRSVVEAAGLIERVDFDVQSSISSDSGAGRPDMIVRLPGGKSIAVDAKVPFSSYLEASAIPSTASGAELARRELLMKAHVKAVRDHITTLGSKAYWNGLEASPEMVIAFIPSESLVSSALEADPSIMQFAFDRHVALTSPVTLWSVLKTVAFSWQQDVVTQEAKTLFDLSRELYGRLSTMANHVSKLGRSIERSVRDYNSFVGSLERQVLPSARKLNMLDETKVLPALEGVEESPRELTAFELTTIEHELEAVAERPSPIMDPALPKPLSKTA